MPTEQVDAVLDEIESPSVGELSALRVGTAPGLEHTGLIAEQVDRLLRKLESAEITESDGQTLNLLGRIRKKLERAKADADESRQMLRRSGEALREAQAMARLLYDDAGREVPAHLEEVPGREFSALAREVENVTE